MRSQDLVDKHAISPFTVIYRPITDSICEPCIGTYLPPVCDIGIEFSLKIVAFILIIDHSQHPFFGCVPERQKIRHVF
ncbi:hypothetical protein D3C81_870790 [compost metagenome]